MMTLKYTLIHHMNSATRKRPASLSSPNPSVDKVLSLEEGSKVEYLPCAKTCEREYCEPCEVLDACIC